MGGEGNGISTNKEPSGGSARFRMPKFLSAAFEETALKKNPFPTAPTFYYYFFLLKSNTPLRATLKYLPKPEQKGE